MKASTLNPPASLHWLGVILINIFPLLGVFVWQWQPLNVVMFYWLENIVIGAFVILRILAPQSAFSDPTTNATRNNDNLKSRLFKAAFFSLHYGTFCAAHGLFILNLFTDINIDLLAVFGYAWQWLHDNHLQWAIYSLFIAHAVYFSTDLMSSQIESSSKEMEKPYKRIVILHIAIILGGILAETFSDKAMPIMLLIIVIRIAQDFYFYRKKRSLSTH